MNLIKNIADLIKNRNKTKTCNRLNGRHFLHKKNRFDKKDKKFL